MKIGPSPDVCIRLHNIMSSCGCKLKILHQLREGAPLSKRCTAPLGMHSACTGTDLDGRAVNRPGKDTVEAVEDLPVGIILVGRRRQLLPDRNENFEHGDTSVGIIVGKEESNPQRTNLDGLFRSIYSGRTLLHSRPL